jgi:hypothetical protein
MADVREPTTFGREQIGIVIDTPSRRQYRFGDGADLCSALKGHDTVLGQ